VSSLPTPDEDLGTALDRLPATRRATLEALRRAGEATADDLADELGVTASALRQQLAGLAADGLVASRPVPSGPGRPRSRWSLTASGLALFPRAYGQLTTELLGYLEAVDPELVDRLFEQRRRRRTEATLARLGGRPFDERVAELARVLDEDGYLADAERLDDGSWRITEHNCAITDVARRFGQACTSEIQFLRDALPDARVERVAHMIAGAHVCAYEVRPI
jgi:DeoR family suf operon transcriptional repressor